MAAPALWAKVRSMLEGCNPKIVESWSSSSRRNAQGQLGESCCQADCGSADNNPLVLCAEESCNRYVHIDCCLTHSEDGLRVRGDGRLEFFCPDHARSILYCICKKPFKEGTPMIQCDMCQEWIHFSCAGIDKEQSSFECKVCTSTRKKLSAADLAAYIKKKKELSIKKDEQDLRNKTVLCLLEALRHRAGDVAQCVDDLQCSKKNAEWVSLFRNDASVQHCIDCLLDLEAPDKDKDGGGIPQNLDGHKEWTQVAQILQQCCQTSTNPVLREWHSFLSAHVRLLRDWAEQAGEVVFALLSLSVKGRGGILGEGLPNRILEWSSNMLALRSLSLAAATMRCGLVDMRCFDGILECAEWVESVFQLISTFNPDQTSSGAGTSTDSSTEAGINISVRGKAGSTAQVLNSFKTLLGKGDTCLRKLQASFLEAKAAIVLPDEENSAAASSSSASPAEAQSSLSLQSMYYTTEFIAWFESVLLELDCSIKDMQDWRKEVDKMLAARDGQNAGCTILAAKNLVQRGQNSFPVRIDSLPMLQELIEKAEVLEKRVITILFAALRTCRDIDLDTLERLADEADEIAGISLPSTKFLAAALRRLNVIQSWGERGILAGDDDHIAEDGDTAPAPASQKRQFLPKIQNLLAECRELKEEWEDPTAFPTISPLSRLLSAEIDTIQKKFFGIAKDIELIGAEILSFAERRLQKAGHISLLESAELAVVDDLLKRLEASKVESVHEKFLRAIRAMHVSASAALALKSKGSSSSFALDTVESTLADLKLIANSKEKLPGEASALYQKLFKACKADLKQLSDSLGADFEKDMLAWNVFHEALTASKEGKWELWVSRQTSSSSASLGFEYSTESIEGMSLKDCFLRMHSKIKSSTSLERKSTENMLNQMLHDAAELERSIALHRTPSPTAPLNLTSLQELATHANYQLISSDALLLLRECLDIASLNALSEALERGNDIVDVSPILRQSYSWVPAVTHSQSDGGAVAIELYKLAQKLSSRVSHIEASGTPLASVASLASNRYRHVGWFAEVRTILLQRGDFEVAQAIYNKGRETTTQHTDNAGGNSSSPLRASSEWLQLEVALGASQSLAGRCEKPLGVFRRVIAECNTFMQERSVSDRTAATRNGKDLVRDALQKWEEEFSKTCTVAGYGSTSELLDHAIQLLADLKTSTLNNIAVSNALQSGKTHIELFADIKPMLLRVWSVLNTNPQSRKEEKIKLANLKKAYTGLERLSKYDLHCSIADALLTEIRLIFQEHDDWLILAHGVYPQKATRGAIRQLPQLSIVLEVLNVPISKAIDSPESILLDANASKCAMFLDSVRELLSPRRPDARISADAINIFDLDFVDEYGSDSSDEDGGDAKMDDAHDYSEQIVLENRINKYKLTAGELLRQADLLDVDVNQEICVLNWIYKLMEWTFIAPKECGRKRDLVREGIDYESMFTLLGRGIGLVDSLPENLLNTLRLYGIVNSNGAAEATLKSEIYSNALDRRLNVPVFSSSTHWLLRNSSEILIYLSDRLNEAETDGKKLLEKYEALRAKEKSVKGGEKSAAAVPLFAELKKLKEYASEYNRAKLGHVIHFPKRLTTPLTRGLFVKESAKGSKKDMAAYKDDFLDSSDEDVKTVAKGKGKGKGKGKEKEKAASDDLEKQESSSESGASQAESSSGSESESDSDDGSLVEENDDLAVVAAVTPAKIEKSAVAVKRPSAIIRPEVKPQVDQSLFHRAKVPLNASQASMAALPKLLKKDGSESSIGSSAKEKKNEDGTAGAHKSGEKRKREKEEEARIAVSVLVYNRVNGKLCCNKDCKATRERAAVEDPQLSSRAFGNGFVPMLQITGGSPAVFVSKAMDREHYCCDACAEHCVDDLFSGMLKYRARLAAATAGGSLSGDASEAADGASLLKSLSEDSSDAKSKNSGSSSSIQNRSSPTMAKSVSTFPPGSKGGMRVTGVDFASNQAMFGGTTRADRRAFAARSFDVRTSSVQFVNLWSSANSNFPTAIGAARNGMGVGEATARAFSAAEWTAQAAIEQARVQVYAALGDLAKKPPKVHSFAEQNSKRMLSTEERSKLQVGGTGSDSRRKLEQGQELLTAKLELLNDVHAVPPEAGKAANSKLNEELSYSHMPVSAASAYSLPADSWRVPHGGTTSAANATIAALGSRSVTCLERVSAERALRKVLFGALLSLTHNSSTALLHASILAAEIEDRLVDIHKPAFTEKEKDGYKRWVEHVKLLKDNLDKVHVRNTIVKRLLADYNTSHAAATAAVMNVEALCQLKSAAFRSEKMQQDVDDEFRYAASAAYKESSVDRRGELMRSTLGGGNGATEHVSLLENPLWSAGSNGSNDGGAENSTTNNNAAAAAAVGAPWDDTDSYSLGKRLRNQQSSLHSDDVHLMAIPDGRTLDRMGGSGATDEESNKRSREMAREAGGASATVTDCDSMTRSHLTKYKNPPSVTTVLYEPGVGVKLTTRTLGSAGGTDDRGTADDSHASKTSAREVEAPIANTFVPAKKGVVSLAERIKSSSREGAPSPSLLSIPATSTSSSSGSSSGGFGSVAKASSPSAAAAAGSRMDDSEDTFAPKPKVSFTSLEEPHSALPSWALPEPARSPPGEDVDMDAAGDIYVPEEALERIPIPAPKYAAPKLYQSPTYLLSQDATAKFSLSFRHNSEKFDLECIAVTNDSCIQGLLPPVFVTNGRWSVDDLESRFLDGKIRKKSVFVPIVITFSDAASGASEPLRKVFWNEYVKGGSANKVAVCRDTKLKSHTLYLVPPKHREKLSIFKKDPVLGDEGGRKRTHFIAGTAETKYNCLYGVVEFPVENPPNSFFLGEYAHKMEGLLSKAALHVNTFCGEVERGAGSQSQADKAKVSAPVAAVAVAVRGADREEGGAQSHAHSHSAPSASYSNSLYASSSSSSSNGGPGAQQTGNGTSNRNAASPKAQHTPAAPAATAGAGVSSATTGSAANLTAAAAAAAAAAVQDELTIAWIAKHLGSRYKDEKQKKTAKGKPYKSMEEHLALLRADPRSADYPFLYERDPQYLLFAAELKLYTI